MYGTISNNYVYDAEGRLVKDRQDAHSTLFYNKSVLEFLLIL